MYMQFCLGILITAIIPLVYIPEVEDFVENYDGRLDLDKFSGRITDTYVEYDEYGTFEADGARVAAAWSLFVCSASIIITSILTIVRCHLNRSGSLSSAFVSLCIHS